MSKKVDQAVLVLLIVMCCATTSGCGALKTHAKIAGGRIEKVLPEASERQRPDQDPGSQKWREKPFSLELVLTPQQERAAGIQTVKACNGSVAGATLELSSTVETPVDTTGILYSPVNGVVSRVLVDVGDHVRRGQVVAFVNSPDISDTQAAYLEALAKLSQATAQLESVKARLELSKANERRMSQLNEEGITAKKDVENARAALAAVRSEEAAAEGAVSAALAFREAARVKLKSIGLKEPDTLAGQTAQTGKEPPATSLPVGSQNVVTSELPIRSPATGVVVERDVFAGQSVGPGSMAGSTAGDVRSTALLTVADLHKVWVMLEVPQREIARIKLGSYIDFRSECIPDKPFKGQITKLAESFDPHSRMALVRAELDNPDCLLKPGMLVIASLERTIVTANEVTVPSSAVQSIAGRDIVFVRRSNHRYQARQVACGERSDTSAEIKSGLSSGEQVVAGGAFYLKAESMRQTISGGANEN